VSHALLQLLERYGYLVVFAFFITEGVGLPVPAETMLVTAAAFAARGKLSLAGLVLSASAGGIVGGSAGYWIGRVGGLRVIRILGRLIRMDHEKLANAQDFFRERGTGAAFLGRFIAFLRIVIPMLIGLSLMRFARFSVFNAAGSIAAALVYGALGYSFGRDLPTLMHHLALTSIVGLVFAVLAAGLHLWRRRGARKRLVVEQPNDV
jgi:membrane protein DedA with SNARE-associated domain